ncbi:RNA-binding protein 42 [Perkinsus chesapeaki]|uniref:RNA-binding protein 42 n=1 Tax=Perkinsus chesapeaki TaxID=330153 RepID=A0A7J6MHF2_PERCH|nr:RNA-binding protein 42 [Perkinsus chesapeaki]
MHMKILEEVDLDSCLAYHIWRYTCYQGPYNPINDHLDMTTVRQCITLALPLAPSDILAHAFEVIFDICAADKRDRCHTGMLLRLLLEEYLVERHERMVSLVAMADVALGVAQTSSLTVGQVGVLVKTFFPSCPMGYNATALALSREAMRVHPEGLVDSNSLRVAVEESNIMCHQLITHLLHPGRACSLAASEGFDALMGVLKNSIDVNREGGDSTRYLSLLSSTTVLERILTYDRGNPTPLCGSLQQLLKLYAESLLAVAQTALYVNRGCRGEGSGLLGTADRKVMETTKAALASMLTIIKHFLHHTFLILSLPAMNIPPPRGMFPPPMPPPGAGGFIPPPPFMGLPGSFGIGGSGMTLNGVPAGVVAPAKRSKHKVKAKGQLRRAGGKIWADPSLSEWPNDDFRIFCGDLGNEVTDELLLNSFKQYRSLQMAKIVRDKRSGKSKGYGFLSFRDPEDMIKALKEMNHKYVGNRPITLKRSKWKDKNIDSSRNKKNPLDFHELIPQRCKNLQKFKKLKKTRTDELSGEFDTSERPIDGSVSSRRAVASEGQMSTSSSVAAHGHNDTKEYGRRLEELYAAEGDEIMRAKVPQFMERYSSCPALFFRLVKDKFERISNGRRDAAPVATSVGDQAVADGDPMDILMGDSGADEEMAAAFTEDFKGDPALLVKQETSKATVAVQQTSKKKRGTLPPLDASEYDVFKRYFNGLRSEEGRMYTLPSSTMPEKCVACKVEGHTVGNCPYRRCTKCGEMGHADAEGCQDKGAGTDEQVEKLAGFVTTERYVTGGMSVDLSPGNKQSVVEEEVAIVLGKGTSAVSKDEAAFVLDSLRCTTCGGRGHGLYCKAKRFGLWERPSKSALLGGVDKPSASHHRHSSESRPKKAEEEEDTKSRTREKRKRASSRSRSRRSRTHDSRTARRRESSERHHTRSPERRSERGGTKDDKSGLPKPGGSFFANLPPVRDDRSQQQQHRRSYMRKGVAEGKSAAAVGDSRWAGVGTDVAAESSGGHREWESYGRGYHRGGDYHKKQSSTAGKDEFGRALTLRSREESLRENYGRQREEPAGRKRGIAFGAGGGRSDRDYGGSSRNAWEGSAFQQDDLTSWTRRGDEATRVIDDEASNLNARLIEVDITDLDGRRKVVLLTPGSTMSDLVEWYAARAPDPSKVRVVDVNSGVDYGNREVTVKRLADNQLGRNDQVADINLFMIVDGKDDLPLYSADISSLVGRRDDSPHLDQFVMHSSLDVIDEVMWTTTDNFFPMVDRFNDFLISAFVGASNVRFLLLHRHASVRSPQQLEQDVQNIRTFFQEVHQLFVKVQMNPLYGLKTTGGRQVRCRHFDSAVKELGRRLLL